MRVRLWYSRATGPQRAGGVGVVLVLAALLVLALLPASSKGGAGAQSVAAGGSGTGAGPAAGAGASGGSGQVAGSSGSAAATGAGAIGAPAGSSTAGAAGAALTGGGASAGPGGAASAPGGQGACPGCAAPGGAGGGGAGGTQLAASDQGVTPTTIKVGFLIANTGGLSGSGFVLGLRTDIDQVIKAMVDWVNRHGGVDGRQLTYVTAKVDPLSSSNQQSACIQMTEDQKVFAVLDSASTLGAEELCYGAQHHVPYFDTGLSTVSAGYVAKSFPYQVSTAQDGTRQVLNWANYAQSDGLFKGHKLGILSDQCAPDPDIVNGDLKPVLAKFGVDPVVVSLSCDSSTAQQQIPSAVLQMRQAGVNLVLPATIFTNVQVFLETAQSQAWFPKYTASDYYGMSIDLFTQNFPAQEWNGTQAVTASLDYQGSLDNPSPQLKDCNDALAAEGVPPIRNYDADSEALVHCDSIHLLVAALKRAGANPTRLSWAQAVQGLGAFPSAFAASALFKPGKTEGGDTLGLTQWSGGCKCYGLVRPVNRPAYA
ncbi:MAG TPA: hypothetical protein VFH45_02295 [Acidimicrobiales bacterium]|nr:hypothetical protein [Acidimicrobiales bacterium]